MNVGAALAVGMFAALLVGALLGTLPRVRVAAPIRMGRRERTATAHRSNLQWRSTARFGEGWPGTHESHGRVPNGASLFEL